jgi:hypothetical protein
VRAGVTCFRLLYHPPRARTAVNDVREAVAMTVRERTNIQVPCLLRSCIQLVYERADDFHIEELLLAICPYAGSFLCAPRSSWHSAPAMCEKGRALSLQLLLLFVRLAQCDNLLVRARVLVLAAQLMALVAFCGIMIVRLVLSEACIAAEVPAYVFPWDQPPTIEK